MLFPYGCVRSIRFRKVSVIKSRQLIIYFYGGQARIFGSFVLFVISVCFVIFDVNKHKFGLYRNNTWQPLLIQVSNNDERAREAMKKIICG